MILFGIIIEEALKSEQSEVRKWDAYKMMPWNQVIKTHRLYTTGVIFRIPKIPIVFYLKLMEEDVYIANCSIIWFYLRYTVHMAHNIKDTWPDKTKYLCPQQQPKLISAQELKIKAVIC